MKKNLLFTLVFRIMGILVLILGVRMVCEGVYNYIDEHHQKDWVPATAFVVDISSEYSGSRHTRSISYDITYEYEADGNTYSGMLYNRSRAMQPGETVQIKYDPDAPEHSTDILAPSLKNLLIFLVAGSVFAIIGYFFSGAWALVRRIRGKDQEEEVLPPEEYLDIEE